MKPPVRALVPAKATSRRKSPLVVNSPKKLDEWESLVPLWLHNRPLTTQEVYEPVIQDFRKFLGGRLISQVTLKDLQDYENQFIHQKPRTTARKLATIKSLLTFGHRTGLLAVDVGKAHRTVKIPDDLANKILEAEDIRGMIKAEPNERNRVMMRLMYGCGLRASETAHLLWQDVQERDTGGQVVIRGKGGKVRVIRVSKEVWKALIRIRPADAKPGDPVFFHDRTKKRLTRQTITGIVAAAATRFGVEKKVSAHWLRHGHATHALDAGASLPLIAATLGHANIQTTTRYLHVRPEESSASYVRG